MKSRQPISAEKQSDNDQYTKTKKRKRSPANEITKEARELIVDLHAKSKESCQGAIDALNQLDDLNDWGFLPQTKKRRQLSKSKSNLHISENTTITTTTTTTQIQPTQHSLITYVPAELDLSGEQQQIQTQIQQQEQQIKQSIDHQIQQLQQLQQQIQQKRQQLQQQIQQKQQRQQQQQMKLPKISDKTSSLFQPEGRPTTRFNNNSMNNSQRCCR